MVENIILIDPEVNTAKELYEYLNKEDLFNPNGNIKESEFYISVPNKDNENIQVENDGRFTYEYKYGRNAGEIQEYVKVVPFSRNDISDDILTRFQEQIPYVYQVMQNFKTGRQNLKLTKMKNITSVLFFLLLSSFLVAQTATGNIENYMDNIIDNVPGSSGDNYVIPNASELNKWGIIIDFIMVENLIEARSNADELNYQVTEFTDTSITPNQVFYILEEKNTQFNYWGTYVFSKTPTRNNLIIQAPHIKYDTNTGKQAIYCFKNNIARAVFINGTHRCNSDSFSTCSGTTSACGSSDNYKMSDLAHTTTSMFQKTTENMFNSISNSVFVQLHGFGKRSTDPYVIMSNGTRETPVIDYADLIKEALLVEDNTLTFKLAHKNQNWTRLIGFTNTQGRMINGSPDYCNTSATSTSGRFIHIEQEKSKLRNNEVGWAKMSNALSNVFSSTLGTNNLEIANSIIISPNPSFGLVKVSGRNIDSIEIYNILGQKLSFVNNPNYKDVLFVDLKNMDRGIYYFRINSKNRISITRKIIRL